MLKVEEEEDGYIKIKKVASSNSEYLAYIIRNIGNNLSSQEVDILISDLLSYDLINEKEARLLKVATSDNVLNLAKEQKDLLRAKIFKNMLLNLID